MNQPLFNALFDETERRPLTVSQLTNSIRIALESRFLSVWVEGEISNFKDHSSGPDIARAIRFINAYHERALHEGRHADAVDVLIVGRGGGSTEDLWAFNQEEVARAMRASEIPVISAVGHETDFTIADFAADLRAPTPSAAAALVVREKLHVLRGLAHLYGRLSKGMESRVAEERQRLLVLAGRRVLTEPGRALREWHRRL